MYTLFHILAKRVRMCALIGAIMIVSTLSAYDFQYKNLCYNITNDTGPYTVEVTYQYEFSNKNYEGLDYVTVPDKVPYKGKTYHVTSIGQWAFRTCGSLIAVYLPQSITTIGDEAFRGCEALMGVDMPNSITSIGTGAWYGCSSMSQFRLPQSVEHIGAYAFYGCDNIEQVVIPQGVQNIYDYTFHGCANLQSVTLHDKLYTIGNYAFVDCIWLEEIQLPESLTTIGDYAFYNTRLQQITLPYYLTSIGNYAFYQSSMLRTVYAQSPVPAQLGEQVFMYPVCYIPCDTKEQYEQSAWVNQMEELNEVCEGNQIFYTTSDMHLLEPYVANALGANIVSNIYLYEENYGIITFDEPIEEIGNMAFAMCSTLVSIEIPKTVESIGAAAFMGCKALESIVIPDAVTEIGVNAFTKCDAMRTVTIGHNVDSIGYAAFYGNPVDTLYIKPATPPALGELIFSAKPVAYVPCDAIGDYVASDWMQYISQIHANCNSLFYRTTDNQPINFARPDAFGANITAHYFSEVSNQYVVNFDDTVRAIGDYAFIDCQTLQSIILPLTTKTIGNSAFAGCTALKQVAEIEQVERIEEAAFHGCSALEEVKLDAVTFIGNNAFASCSSLMNILLPNQQPLTVGENAFNGCSGLTYVYVPATIAHVPYGMFSDCEKLQDCTLGEGVLTIGSAAFANCVALQNIYLPSSVLRIGSAAYSGCDSVMAIYSMAELPPVLENRSFGNIDPQTLVIVPCAAEVAYTHTSGWDYFANYNEQAGGIVEIEDTICFGQEYYWETEIYTESGFYTQTFTSSQGCDSIVNLHLTVLPEVPVTYIDTTICNGQDLIWNNQVLTQSGQYTYTLVNQYGCDSTVVLNLTIYPQLPVTYIDTAMCAGDTMVWNNMLLTRSGEYSLPMVSATGCDSIVTLRLTVWPVLPFTDVEQTICDGEILVWNDMQLADPGEYTARLTSSTGCDSLVRMTLSVLPSVEDTYVERTICHGESYTWHGETYYEEGEYSITLQNMDGCDSTVILNLFVLPEPLTDTLRITRTNTDEPYVWYNEQYTTTGRYKHAEQYATFDCDSVVHVLELTVLVVDNYDEETIEICNTELPYLWRDQTLTRDGRYTITEKYANTHYDSIQHILNLNVNPSSLTEQWHSICEGERYEWNGEVYTQEGEYSVTLTNSKGCDSIVILHLHITPKELIYDTITRCDSYEWHGKVYTESGDYTYQTNASNGCERVEHLHLTINKSEYVEFDVEVCDSYEWHGQTYTSNGHYVFHGETPTGCPRTEILRLTIHRSERTEQTINACDRYEWNGEVYTESGTYTYNTTTKHGCERTEVLHLTISQSEEVLDTITACDSYEWNGNVYTETGDYIYRTHTPGGCERVEKLHLTINKSEYIEEYVTACDFYEWKGQTYTQSNDWIIRTELETGCERVEILHLTIQLSDSTAEYITACDSYEWKGQIYTESGTYTYRSGDEGCERIETIFLTINHTLVFNDTIEACNNFYWDRTEEVYTESGVYTYRTNASNGCERIENLHLTIHKSIEIEDTVATCHPYEWHGKTYTESGNYLYRSTTEHGCDHVEWLHLIITPTIVTEEHINACDRYEWNGKVYTESGDYNYTTTSANGCDSLVVLHLSMYHSETQEFYVESDVPYLWHDQYYEVSGDYTYTTTGSNGCDHIEILHLTMLTGPVYDMRDTLLCASELPFWWYEQEITEMGFYEHIEYTETGVESAIHYLTVNTYSQTLPTSITQPVVCVGEPIDVSKPTEEIQRYIANDYWYAPNAIVTWFIQTATEWEVLTADPLDAQVQQVILKYVVDTDCGRVESENMKISITTTSTDNVQTTVDVQKVVRDDKVYIIRNNQIYTLMGQKVM